MEAVNNLKSNQRNLICRLVFTGILVCLVYDVVSHATLHQLYNPVLIFPYVDVTYILFNATHIGDVILNSFFLCCLFDILMLALCIAVIIFPDKRIFVAFFVIFYFIYFVIYNSYGAHHVHSKIGILLISTSFLFKESDFIYVWNALRYFTLFIYADAFLWKLFRLTWLNSNQGLSIIKNNIVPILYQHPEHKFAALYYFLFENPVYADIFFKAGCLLEATFIVGFFTKKYDRFLILASILLAVGFLIMADAFAFELLILDFTLLFNYNNSQKSKPLIA